MDSPELLAIQDSDQTRTEHSYDTSTSSFRPPTHLTMNPAACIDLHFSKQSPRSEGTTTSPFPTPCPSPTASCGSFQSSGSYTPDSEEGENVTTPLYEIEQPLHPSIAHSITGAASATGLYGSSVEILADRKRDLDRDIASPPGWIHHVMRVDQGNEDEWVFGNYVS